MLKFENGKAIFESESGIKYDILEPSSICENGEREGTDIVLVMLRGIPKEGYVDHVFSITLGVTYGTKEVEQLEEIKNRIIRDIVENFEEEYGLKGVKHELLTIHRLNLLREFRQCASSITSDELKREWTPAEYSDGNGDEFKFYVKEDKMQKGSTICMYREEYSEMCELEIAHMVRKSDNEDEYRRIASSDFPLDEISRKLSTPICVDLTTENDSYLLLLYGPRKSES